MCSTSGRPTASNRGSQQTCQSSRGVSQGPRVGYRRNLNKMVEELRVESSKAQSSTLEEELEDGLHTRSEEVRQHWKWSATSGLR